VGEAIDSVRAQAGDKPRGPDDSRKASTNGGRAGLAQGAVRNEGDEMVMPFPVKITHVLDGDTIRGTIELPWGVGLVDRPIWLLGYDAWEMHKRRGREEISPEEIVKGKAARDALVGLVREAKAAVVENSHGLDYDVYGRVLASLKLFIAGDWIDVATWMVVSGHCRPERSKATADELREHSERCLWNEAVAL